MTADTGVLDPDMPAAEMRMHMGEMTAGEMRVARAAIRWANCAAIMAAVRVVEAEREERRAGNQTDGLWTAAQKIRALRKGGDDGR